MSTDDRPAVVQAALSAAAIETYAAALTDVDTPADALTEHADRLDDIAATLADIVTTVVAAIVSHPRP